MGVSSREESFIVLASAIGLPFLIDNLRLGISSWRRILSYGIAENLKRFYTLVASTSKDKLIWYL